MKTKLAPPRLETKRTFPTPGPVPIGKTEDADLVLSGLDRMAHTHVLGASGGGKSKLMELLVREDLHDPSIAAVVVDPHGSLVADVLEYAAQHRQLAERIVIVDPGDMGTHVLGFNPIPTSEGQPVSTITSLASSACLKAWNCNDETAMPRTGRWLDNLILPVVVNGLTLLETVAMMNVHSGVERDKLLERVTSDTVLGDWKAFSGSPMRERMTLLEGASNRLSKAVRSEALSLMLGQRQHALSLAECFEKGKVVLVSLNGHGVVADEHMRLLGVLLVNEIYRVGLQRDRTDPKLKPVRVYLDEFSRFTTRQVGLALEELRKFKVFFTLAHQHLEQLKKEDDYLFNSVLTNCKNKVVFGGLSVPDATILAQELMTGYFDLNETKYSMKTSRISHVEETRTVYGSSSQETTGVTESTGLGTTESDTVSEGIATGTGTTVTDTTSGQETWSEGETTGETVTVGETKGKSDTRNRGTGRSEGTQKTLTVGGSESWGDGITAGTSSNASTGTSETTPKGDQLEPEGTVTSSSGSGSGQTEGSSHTEGGSSSLSVAHGKNQARSFHEGEGHTDSRSSTVSTGANRATSLSRGGSLGTAHGVAKQQTETVSRGKAHGTTTSRVVTTGQSTGKTKGFSVSVVPFLNPVERQEESSRTVYTLEEQIHRVVGMLKNLPVGTCMMKLGPERPRKVTVTRVDPVTLSPRVMAARVEAFKQEIYRRNPAWYLPLDRARAIIENRQMKLFKKVLCMTDAPAPAIDVELVEEPRRRQTEDEPEGPFEP